MGFGYRTANVPADHVVLDAKILLRYGDAGKIKARVKEIMAGGRNGSLGLPNAGPCSRIPRTSPQASSLNRGLMA